MRRVTAPLAPARTFARVAQPRLRLARAYSGAAKAEKKHVVEVKSDKEWESAVVEGSKKQPVVVDFHATWCGA